MFLFTILRLLFSLYDATPGNSNITRCCSNIAKWYMFPRNYLCYLIVTFLRILREILYGFRAWSQPCNTFLIPTKLHEPHDSIPVAGYCLLSWGSVSSYCWPEFKLKPLMRFYEQKNLSTVGTLFIYFKEVTF